MNPNHIKLSHEYWKNNLSIGDIAIDATIGNGFDFIVLSKLVLSENFGFLYGFDIQKKALQNTKKIFLDNFDKNFLNRTKIFQESHEDFSQILEKPKLIVYNLGYLPGSDKTITTKTESTLKSIKNGLRISQFLSITCYPGHLEGEKEEVEILNFLKNLDRKEFEICYHKWINREKSPTLIWIKNLKF